MCKCLTVLTSRASAMYYSLNKFSLLKEKTVKSMERALVKVEMCYGADVSCLCDLVRQRIVFETLHDQVLCLRTMADGIQFLKSLVLRHCTE